MDGTVGGGGHALLILEACADCRLLAVDRDPEAVEDAGERVDRLTDDIAELVADAL